MVSEKLFSEADIKAINEQSDKAASEEIDKAIKKSKEWIQLKNAARNFIDLYNMTQEPIKIHFNKKYSELTDAEKAEKRLNSSRLQTYNQIMYREAFQFDLALDIYRESLPKSLLYTYTSKKRIATFEMPIEFLVNFVTSEGRIKGLSYKSLRKNFIEKEKSNDLEQQGHIAMAIAAYRGVEARLNRFYEKYKTGQRQGGLLMWKLNDEWTVAKVTNLGDVKEAYQRALMTPHKSDLDILCEQAMGSPPYYDHGLISTFFQNISQVTNKAAIIEEDIVFEDIQYSSKSAGASLPGLNQYIEVAKYILDQGSQITIEQINQEIKNKFPQDSARNKILEMTLVELTRDAIEDLLAPIEKFSK